jgi:hypothetical protein
MTRLKSILWVILFVGVPVAVIVLLVLWLKLEVV